MKIYKIIFLSDALEDMKEAKKWYDKQQKGLGKRLMADVRQSISELRKNAFIGSVKYMDIRTVSCANFPYAIHYSIDELNTEVIILSIFHLHRKPFWD